MVLLLQVSCLRLSPIFFLLVKILYYYPFSYFFEVVQKTVFASTLYLHNVSCKKRDAHQPPGALFLLSHICLKRILENPLPIHPSACPPASSLQLWEMTQTWRNSEGPANSTVSDSPKTFRPLNYFCRLHFKVEYSLQKFEIYLYIFLISCCATARVALSMFAFAPKIISQLEKFFFPSGFVPKLSKYFNQKW